MVVLPADAASPLGKHEEVSWLEVMQHVAKRLTNVNPSFRTTVLTDKELQVSEPTFLNLAWLCEDAYSEFLSSMDLHKSLQESMISTCIQTVIA